MARRHDEIMEEYTQYDAEDLVAVATNMGNPFEERIAAALLELNKNIKLLIEAQEAAAERIDITTNKIATISQRVCEVEKRIRQEVREFESERGRVLEYAAEIILDNRIDKNDPSLGQER